MATSLEQAFQVFLDEDDPERRARYARDFLRRDVSWASWLPLFNAAHVTRPEAEARAAGALAAAAGRARRPAEAARFRLLQGRGLQRAGSPVEAASTLARAARGLRAEGDALRAAQADVLRVDALAVAGRAAAAVSLAEETRPRLRGRGLAPLRAALDINRANALRLRGALTEAVQVYDRAARELRRAGDAHTAAIAEANAGTALVDAGHASRARPRFESAAAVFAQAGQDDMALETRYNLATALVGSGSLGEGLALLEEIEAVSEARGLARRVGLAAMDLAVAFLKAGERREAEERALKAAEAFARDGARAERVEALWLAAASAAPAAPDRAATHLARAERAAARTGRPGLELRCRLLREDLRLRRGRLPDARRLAAIRRRASAQGQDELAAQTLLLAGEAALARAADGGRGAATRARACFADPMLRRPGRPWLRAAADTGLARADALLGRTGAAVARLRQVCRFLDRVRGGLAGPWLRAAFVLERLDPYLTRVDLLLDRGRPEDHREAEALLDALAARRFLEARGDGPRGTGDTATRRRLEAIYDRLARGSGPTRGFEAGERVRLHAEAKRLEREIADAWRQAERRGAPRAALNLAVPRSSSVPQGVTAVYVWRRGDNVRGLARIGNDARAEAMLGTVADLMRLVGRLAFHASRAARSRAGAVAFETVLRELSDRALLPLAPARWTPRVRLVIDPEAADIPWELLPLDGVPLAAARDLMRVPSLRVRRPRTPRGEGIEVLALGEEDLPGIGREVAGITTDVPVRAGAAANHDAVVRALVGRRVVHLAGHGFDAVEAPGLGGVRLADGWFGAEDVPERIAADLVVLSACRTGREAGGAAAAWGGLPSTLLAAGARFVLWTTDDVDDTVTAELMQRFHAALETRSVPAAFGHALAACRTARGHGGGLLPFRLSGVLTR